MAAKHHSIMGSDGFHFQRIDNILKDDRQGVIAPNPEEDRSPIAPDYATPSPERARTSSTNIDDNDDLAEIKKVQTGRTVRDRREFEPICSGDQERLERLASNLTGLSPIPSGTDELERKDTLYGVKIGDPVLDPKSPEFDLYKWVRM